MANIENRLKAPKGVMKKKCGRSNSKRSLTGGKDAATSSAKPEKVSCKVMERTTNHNSLALDNCVKEIVVTQSVTKIYKDTTAINKTPKITTPVKRTTRRRGMVCVDTTDKNSNSIKNIKKKIKLQNHKNPPARKGNGSTSALGRNFVFNKDIKQPPLSKTKSGRIKKKNKSGLKLIDDILKSELMILEGLIPKNGKRVQPVNNNDNDLTNQNNMVMQCDESHKTNTQHSMPKTTLTKISKSPKIKQISLSKDIIDRVTEFVCDYCKKTFNGKSSLRRHMYGHLGKLGYACPWCKKQYLRRENLQNHVDKLHPSSMENCEDYICHICLAPFLDKDSLNLHMLSHVKNEKHKCIYCDKKFAHHFLLVEHEKQHLVTGRHQCTQCNKNFTHRNQMHLHLKRHMNIKDYICYACGKVFLRKNSLSRHEVTCHGDLKIQCQICKKYLKGHLSEHMRTHDDERPHECPECGQRFRQSTQLTVHRRCHSGDKPYHCRICGRSFTYSNALMMHIRRHTGEKPFLCAMCPNAFTQLPHMKAHMMKIHGQENPYKCPKCHQFFKLKSQLDSHTEKCTVGDVEMSFEEKLNMSFKVDDDETVSVMSLSRMRFLLALLLTMIASDEKLKFLGFNKRLIDDLLVEALEAMGCTPSKDESLSPFKRLKTNIDMLMIGTVPKGQMEKFRKERKTTEELLELLTFEK